MKTQLKSLLWAGFFLFSMTQCQFCVDCPYATFPPEAESYFEFEEGSYWIYRNTINGDLDSLYVGHFEKVGNRKKGDCRDDSILQGISSKKLNDKVIFYWNLTAKNNMLVGYNFVASINFNTVRTVTFSGKSYEKVVELQNCCLVNCPNTVTNDNCGNLTTASLIADNLVFAPDIGLVKWETVKHPIYGKATFELIKYKILKS